MSEGEILVLMLSFLGGGASWLSWYHPLASVVTWPPAGGIGKALGLAPVFCLGGLLVVLTTGASFDVVDAPEYIFFYLAMGMAWLGFFRLGLSILGILWRDDALERGNRAAAISVVAGMVGLTACFAGANIGDGPDWSCVVFPAFLATLAWFILVAGFQAATNMVDKITIERDEAASIRHGGLMVAMGLVCGRGAAGDWTSAADTVAEFWVTLPAILLVVVAAWVERGYRPDELRREATAASQRLSSAALAVFYMLLAVTFIAWSLPLPSNPKYRTAAQTEERE